MSERYQPHPALEYVTVWFCTHCGCVVWDRELHDQVNGLDLLDMAEKAMKGSTPLAPPEPPA